MKRIYKIKGSSSSAEENEGYLYLLKKKDYFKKSGGKNVDEDVFRREDFESDFWPHINNELRKIISPYLNSPGIIRFLIIAIISVILNFIWKLNEPLVRGWRLQVVKNLALGSTDSIPSSKLDQLFKYYKKGLVLMFSRFVYFLPVIIIGLLSGGRMLGLVKETLIFFWDKFINAEDLGILEFLFKKVIPQFGIEIIIQLIVLTLYGVLIWPIYRIIMIRYAIGNCRGWDFFSLKTIKDAAMIFKNNAGIIYGIYAFVLAIDVFVAWFSWTLGWLLLIIMPVFILFARHWVKGYSYGVLGQELIKRGAISNESNLI